MPETQSFDFTSGSFPAGYDRFLAPRLFEPWARLLIEEIALQPHERVLDVATGTGVVAREAASVTVRGRVMGTDISPPMLAIARRKGSPEGASPIEYVDSPAAPLAAPSDAFDVGLCQQGLQFFPEPVAALEELRRALVPEGRLGVTVWCALEECAIFHAYQRGVARAIGEEVAAMMRKPFIWKSGRDLEHMAAQAGFKDVRVESRSLPLTFEEGLEQAVDALWGTPMHDTLNSYPPETIHGIRAAVREALAPLVQGPVVTGPMKSYMLFARA